MLSTEIVFEAEARQTNSQVISFRFEVSSTDFDEGRGHYRELDCPFLRERPFRIFGVDGKQAAELCFSFTAGLVEDRIEVFLDSDGREISLSEALRPDGPFCTRI